MTHSDAKLWAQEQFEQAQLKDPRRTQRLISLTTSIANQPGVSVAKLPFSPADMGWAYTNLAKLGGWKDTKRTGRDSIKVLWEGWFKLKTILEGYELVMSLDH